MVRTRSNIKELQIMLSDIQKARLKAVVRTPADYTQTNKDLDEAIMRIQTESPELYWNKWNIDQRRFACKPRQIVPMAGYLYE
jgi:hypothetical protein